MNLRKPLFDTNGHPRNGPPFTNLISGRRLFLRAVNCCKNGNTYEFRWRAQEGDWRYEHLIWQIHLPRRRP